MKLPAFHLTVADLGPPWGPANVTDPTSLEEATDAFHDHEDAVILFIDPENQTVEDVSP